MSRRTDYPLIDIWPYKVKNVNNFYHRNHISGVRQDTPEWKDYYKELIKYCVVGKWVYDEGTWVFMFPVLFWYINIIKIANKAKRLRGETGTISPRLRDNEWIYFAYDFITDGFSGFMKDNEVTCNYTVGLIQKGEEVDEYSINQLSPYCYKANGELKKFIEPWDYLRTYYTITNPSPEPLGDPLYENSIENGQVLTCRGLGKDNKWDTIVYKEDGPCIIDSIKVGDKIYGDDGKLTTVIDRADYNNQMQYKVTFDDGRVTYCGDGHLWSVYTRCFWNDRDQRFKEQIVLPLIEVRKLLKKKESVFIPLAKPVQYPKKEYHIDPYVLGYLLGDGGLTSTCINFSFNYPDEEFITERLKNRIGEGVYKKSDRHRIRISKAPNLIKHIKELGINVRGDFKFIPKEYLYGSEKQRRDLLSGLLDSDGHVAINKSGNGKLKSTIGFTTTSYKLSVDFVSLCNSLGLLTSVHNRSGRIRKGNTCKDSYDVVIHSDEKLFKLDRKNDAIIDRVHGSATKVKIRSIEPHKVERSVCLGVDNATSLFLCDNYIVTHNSLMGFPGKAFHVFTFNGVKYWQDYKYVEENSYNIFLGSPREDKIRKSLAMIKFARRNLPGEYSYIDDRGRRRKELSPFYTRTKGSWVVGEFVERTYKEQGGIAGDDEGSSTSMEFKSMVAHDIATGDRYILIEIEEHALLRFLKQFYGSVEDSMIALGEKSGKLWLIGTGGDIEAVQDTKHFFYNIASYHIAGIPNYWNPNSKATKIPLFIPIQYKYDKYKDKNGNTMLKEAHAEALKEEEKKYKSGIDDHKNFLMNNPFIPEHIFYTSTISVFPSEEAAERVAYLESGIWEQKARVGWLFDDAKAPNGVKFVEDNEKYRPILNYIGVNTQEMSKEEQRGAVIIYELPTYPIKPNLYKLVVDTVYKAEGGPSFNCAWIYKGIDGKGGMQDTIVLEWTGRILDETLDKTFELFLRMSFLYQAKIFPERNLKEFKDWVIFKKKLPFLLQEEAYLIEKDIYKNYNRTREIGFYVRGRKDKIIGITDRWQKEWLLTEKIPADLQNGIPAIRTIDTIYSIRYLNEIAAYTDDGNFDNISVGRGLQLWLHQEDLMGINNSNNEEEDDMTNDEYEEFIIEQNKMYNINVKNNDFFD